MSKTGLLSGVPFVMVKLLIPKYLDLVFCRKSPEKYGKLWCILGVSVGGIGKSLATNKVIPWQNHG